MKKLASVLLLLVLCLGLAGTVFASVPDAFVVDEADLLSPSEEDSLNETLRLISRTHNAQVVVVTVSSVESWDVDGFTEDVYDNSGFGYGPGHDGVLLLVCMNPREYRILSNGFAADALGGWEIEDIGERIVSDLSDGYYADAFEEFADQCDYYLDGHINGFPFDFGKKLVIALVIGLVAGLVTALVLKAQLKSVHMQRQADVYVKSGSMKITDSHDLYLYRNVHRTKKESGGSSRSGSSRNMGGGSF